LGLLIVVLTLLAPKALAATQRPKILVVMSYAVDSEWCQAIRQGIGDRLAESCDLFYEYINSRTAPESIAQRAAAAFSRFQKLKPQGVIAADDSAQTHFVIPYLRNKVDTPVIFCGVNAAPDAYNYPAKNVTGILERYHIGETIALLQLLVPGAQRVAFIGADSPTGRPMIDQARKEVSDLPLSRTRFDVVKDMAELKQFLIGIRGDYDALYLSLLLGLKDEKGALISTRSIIHTITTTFGKPVVSAAPYDLPHGVLCSVVHTGEEQGRLAADLMAQALSGVPVAQLPIARNYNGQRVINVTAMQNLGIHPRPILLRGAKLIRSAP
jgi:ABC-type uncharacterized transport system substrate-binding protein